MSASLRILCLVLVSVIFVAAHPQRPSAMECTAHVRFDIERDHLVTGELNASASEEDPYPHRRVASVDVGAFGIRSHALCENILSSTTFITTPRVYGELTLTDVVFSSEGSEPVPVSLNLDLDGRFNLTDLYDTYSLGKFVLNAIVNGTTFPGEVHVCTMYCVQIQTGLLEGFTGRSFPNVRLTTPEVMVPVNEPVTVTINMNLIISVDRLPVSRGEGLFEDTFTFARTGPVFNVPAGVNVNSEQSVILDNTYVAGNTVPVSPKSWGAIKELYR